MLTNEERDVLDRADLSAETSMADLAALFRLPDEVANAKAVAMLEKMGLHGARRGAQLRADWVALDAWANEGGPV